MSGLKVSCKLGYEIQTPSSLILKIAAAGTHRQQITGESLQVDPPGTALRWSEPEDSGYRSIRLESAPGLLSLHYAATVILQPSIDDAPRLDEVEHGELPDHTLPYLNPSRYCEVDRLGRIAWNTFGHLTPGYSRVEAICDWVRSHVDYIAGSTDSSSSACDVLIQRAGVCRDFAHVAIALCRALGIPARYVAGYAAGLEPPDFHGFFEAFFGNDWYMFDATRMAPVDGFVRIAVGRDAADTAFATIAGQAILRELTVSAAGDAPSQSNASDVGIATA